VLLLEALRVLPVWRSRWKGGASQIMDPEESRPDKAAAIDVRDCL